MYLPSGHNAAELATFHVHLSRGVEAFRHLFNSPYVQNIHALIYGFMVGIAASMAYHEVRHVYNTGESKFFGGYGTRTWQAFGGGPSTRTTQVGYMILVALLLFPMTWGFILYEIWVSAGCALLYGVLGILKLMEVILRSVLVLSHPRVPEEMAYYSDHYYPF